MEGVSMGNALVRRVPKRTRDHADAPVLIAYRQHGFWRIPVEGLIYPADEVSRRWLGQFTEGKAAINLPLDSNMRARLDLQIAGLVCSSRHVSIWLGVSIITLMPII
jgi:hypothetical protein